MLIPSGMDSYWAMATSRLPPAAMTALRGLLKERLDHRGDRRVGPGRSGARRKTDGRQGLDHEFGVGHVFFLFDEAETRRDTGEALPGGGMLLLELGPS